MKIGAVIQLAELSDLIRTLTFPDLLDWDKPKKRGSLSGFIEEIAAVLAEYEALGAAHLMFHLRPSTPAAYERLAEAVALYRATKTNPAPAHSGA